MYKYSNNNAVANRPEAFRFHGRCVLRTTAANGRLQYQVYLNIYIICVQRTVDYYYNYRRTVNADKVLRKSTMCTGLAQDRFAFDRTATSSRMVISGRAFIAGHAERIILYRLRRPTMSSPYRFSLWHCVYGYFIKKNFIDLFIGIKGHYSVYV